jgi:hypothetical protein
VEVGLRVSAATWSRSWSESSCSSRYSPIYAGLRRGAGAKTGMQPLIQWGWFAAILGCCLVALLVGLLTRYTVRPSYTRMLWMGLRRKAAYLPGC